MEHNTNWEERFDELFIQVKPVHKVDGPTAQAMQKLFDFVNQKEKQIFKDFISEELDRVRRETPVFNVISVVDMGEEHPWRHWQDAVVYKGRLFFPWAEIKEKTGGITIYRGRWGNE